MTLPLSIGHARARRGMQGDIVLVILQAGQRVKIVLREPVDLVRRELGHLVAAHLAVAIGVQALHGAGGKGFIEDPMLADGAERPSSSKTIVLRLSAQMWG